MTTNRLEYLLQKCKLHIRKSRNTEARAWLEIALDEFPNNRELQRFAGKTYLQWGMTQKAIHFLEVEQTEDNFEAPSEGYDHDKITQDDLAIIEGQLGCTETPWFMASPQEVEVPTPVRKTLSLNKTVGGSGSVKMETDSICSSRSGQKQIAVKHLRTRKASNTSEAAVENESLTKIDAEPSNAVISTEDRITELPQEIGTSLASYFVPVTEDDFTSAAIDELQDVSEHLDPYLHETMETEATLSVLSAPPAPSLSKQIEDFEPQTGFGQSVESNRDHFAQALMTEDEITSDDSQQDWGSDQLHQFHDREYSQSAHDELEWTEESEGLAFYQDDDCLLDFSEEDCELFDVSDDAFLSAFNEFDFDDDLDEEQPVIDEANDGDKLKLTRWERAQQVAVEVIYSTNWSGKYLAFLTDVFFENGWGAARVTIEKEIRSGTTIDELMLAQDFKEIWKNCDRYWITLSKLGPYAQVTEATHRQMSWAQALRIIRCFNWLPSIEELEVFLEDEFEYWYQHSLIRRVFPVFMKYLCYYRAKNTPYMDFELGPYGPEQSDDPMDNGDLINFNSEYRQRLSEAGLDSIAATKPCRTVRQ